MKIGDVVKVKGSEDGYNRHYTVIDIWSGIAGDERLVHVTWQEPHTHTIRTQMIAESCLEKYIKIK